MVLDVPISAARRLHVHTTREILAVKGGTVGENVGWYMPQICDMGPTALLPLQRKARWGFFLPCKILMASAGFEPANLYLKAARYL